MFSQLFASFPNEIITTVVTPFSVQIDYVAKLAIYGVIFFYIDYNMK